MSTPTIEIEASEELHEALQLAVTLLNHERQYFAVVALKPLLTDLVHARCLAKRHDEQQIHLPLPRVTRCTCTVTPHERMENRSCPEHFPPG